MISLFIIGTSTSFAGNMGEAVSELNKFYLGIEGGASISSQIHFQPVILYPAQNEFFITTPNNSDWTRDIGSEGVVGVLLGYQWTSNVAFQFNYAYRNGYNWNILGTETITNLAPVIYDSYFADTINIQTFIFDLKLMPSVNWGGFIPYTKGGVGFAINKIDGLRNIDIPYNGAPLGFNTVIKGDSSTNFSWDAGVGTEYYFNNKLNLGLGYRFVDTGRLKTSNNFTDTTLAETSTISPFVAKHVFLNELVAFVVYHF